ncbi:hypothetical protein EI94DRAFT_1254355 [Lactarius quietus]|nr:hypothetical protein EI94DRAFT_1254355 [Lactarius quietus]
MRYVSQGLSPSPSYDWRCVSSAFMACCRLRVRYSQSPTLFVSQRQMDYLSVSTPAPNPTSTDLLVDGFVARTFAPEDAANYFVLLFRSPQFIQQFGVVYHDGGAWYITHNVNSVQGTSPGVPLQTRPLLDYSTNPTYGTVVPQRRWTPADEVDFRRHVEAAVLQLPLFFVNRNGSIGFPLQDILQGCDRELHHASHFAPLGGKSTTHIRINWPGYRFSKRQIATRDETRDHNPITIGRFMKHVGTSVEKFFRNMANGVVSTVPQWQIGMQGGITQAQVKVIGVIHVSAVAFLPRWTYFRHLRLDSF